VYRRAWNARLLATALCAAPVPAWSAELTLSAPDPGEPNRVNVLTVSGVTAGAGVSLFWSESAGSGAVHACATGLATPTALVTAVADAQGTATFSAPIDASSAGASYLLQAVEDEACRTSEVVSGTWTVLRWLGEWDPEVADGKIRGSHPVDVFGSRLSLEGDADGDGTPDLVVAAPLEDEGGLSESGSVYVFYQPGPGELFADQDEDLELASVEVGDWAGFGLGWGGDLDGNGTDDLLVGARFNGADAGAVFRIPMPVYGEAAQSLEDFPALRGPSNGAQLGLDVGRAPDADGDGLPDLWAAAPMQNQATGAVYLVSGLFADDAVVSEVAITTFVGEASGDQAGLNVDAIGDIDGDGVEDVGLGATGNDANGAQSGTAYLLTRPNLGSHALADADVLLFGDAAGDEFGARIGGLADLDQDGWNDLGINSRGDSTAGPSFGSLSIIGGGPIASHVPIAQVERAKYLGEDDGESAAHFRSCDVDGDGFLDLLTSSFESGPPGPETGRVYLFYGPLAAGVQGLGEADMTLVGTETLQNLGQGLTCVDLNADGFADFATSAEGDDQPWGGNYSGSVYLYFGRAREDADQPPLTGDTGETTEPDEKGCKGCNGTGGGPPSAVLVLASALARRRRRR
jgi:FG-GAP repeat